MFCFHYWNIYRQSQSVYKVKPKDLERVKVWNRNALWSNYDCRVTSFRYKYFFSILQDMNEPANFGTNEIRPWNWPKNATYDWSLKCPNSDLDDPPYKTSTYSVKFVFYTFFLFIYDCLSSRWIDLWFFLIEQEPLWLWWYGSWIYNYLCNQCRSPLKFWVRIPFIERCTRYNIMW